MASELTFDEIHKYLLRQGGRVKNTEIIRHFSHYLKDPLTKDDAKEKFKAYVNELASTRSDGDQKMLTLRPRYQLASPSLHSSDRSPYQPSPKYDPRNSIGIPTSPHHNIGIPLSPVSSPASSGINHFANSPQRVPPPYRPPPPVQSPNTSSSDTVSISSSTFSLNESQSVPQAPPRRKSSDKLLAERREAAENATQAQATNGVNGSQEKENEKPPDNCDKIVSVKERTQKFNRLASVEDEHCSPKNQKPKKKTSKGVDETEGASITTLEPKKIAAWNVAAAKGDYQELAKLANKEPGLVKLKEPYTAYTVLHWGAKHGNQDIIKLFAGTYHADVNVKTNGGYTPLHIAAHFGRKDVYNLLKEVYKADENLRDYRGKKPLQYMATNNQGRGKTTTKIKSRKNKYGDKFLRVGSLNVRVKKTTEAFSSFLGVGSGGSMSSIEPIEEKVHKGWGSADNVAQENVMPAPKGYITKRKAKRPGEARNHSNPGTPNQTQKFIQRNSLQDSDSDTAAGFDSTWQN